MTDEHIAAAKVLASLSPRDAVALLATHHNNQLAEQEAAKTHPMSAFTLPSAEWADLKAHIMDGGGVVDDAGLAVEIMSAVLADDQAAFWPALIHLMKAWLKIRGHMTGLPGGGSFLRGVGPKENQLP